MEAAALVGAVLGAMVDVVLPHVAHNVRGMCNVKLLELLQHIRLSAIHQHQTVLVAPNGLVARPLCRPRPLQLHRQVQTAIGPITAAIPAWRAPPRLLHEHVARRAT